MSITTLVDLDLASSLYLIALGLTLFAVVPAMRSAAATVGSSSSTAGAALSGNAGAARSGNAGAASSATANSTSDDYRRIAITSGVASLLLVAWSS